jgi:lysophospholipase L1-like esterase
VLVPCADGEEISAAFSLSSTFGTDDVVMAGAKLADGGHAIMLVGAGGGIPNVAIYHGTGTPTWAPIPTIGAGVVHASYWVERSLLTVHVHNRRSFSVLVNGVELWHCTDTGSDIVKVGFGNGLNHSASSSSLWCFTRTKHKKLCGKRPLKIYIVGDSITATTIQGNWPYEMLEALESVGGARVDLMHSIAVSGETSTQQLARLAAEHAAGNLAAFDGGVLCLQIGVNDVQAGINESVYSANLVSMIAIGAAHSMTIVGGPPTMWYDRAQAELYGGRGMLTAGYENGSEHRLKALWVFANHGVKVVPVLDELGPVIADYLATTKDTIVRDNIHPTAHASRLIGYAYARAILGALQPAGCASVRGDAIIRSCYLRQAIRRERARRCSYYARDRWTHAASTEGCDWRSGRRGSHAYSPRRDNVRDEQSASRQAWRCDRAAVYRAAERQLNRR